MFVKSLTLYIVEVPLRKQIRHAGGQYSYSTNLVAQCVLGDGTVGWGEGVPRPNVTGETAEMALERFTSSNLSEQLSSSWNSLEEVIELCTSLVFACDTDPRPARANHALRCAVELAVLDAFCRHFRKPLWHVAHIWPVSRAIATANATIRYSTTITGQHPRKERLAALAMRLYGFKHFKVKVGLNPGQEIDRLKRLRKLLGRSVDIRLDANSIWSFREFCELAPAFAALGVSCVEDPVVPNDLYLLAKERNKWPFSIMLDESIVTLEDLGRSIAAQECDIVNIRLSKCGGFLNSLRFATIAARHGLSYQLGCHPGELPILSAAGRHFATAVKNIRYLEGSYDRFLLAAKVSKEDLTFSYGGRARPIHRPGLGVTIDPSRLKPLVKASVCLYI